MASHPWHEAGGLPHRSLHLWCSLWFSFLFGFGEKFFFLFSFSFFLFYPFFSFFFLKEN